MRGTSIPFRCNNRDAWRESGDKLWVAVPVEQAFCVGILPRGVQRLTCAGFAVTFVDANRATKVTKCRGISHGGFCFDSRGLPWRLVLGADRAAAAGAGSQGIRPRFAGN